MEQFIRKNVTVLRWTYLIVMVAITVAGIAVLVVGRIDRLPAIWAFSSSTSLICLIVMLILGFSIFMDFSGGVSPTLDAACFVYMIGAQALVLLASECSAICNGTDQAGFFALVSNSLLFVFTDVLLLLWWRYLTLQCDIIPSWHAVVTRILDVLFLLTVVGALSNIFGSNIFFSIDSDGTYQRSATYGFCLVYSFACFAASIALLAFQQTMRWRARAILSSYIVLPAVAIVLQSFFVGLSAIYLMTSFAIVLLFGNVYVERGRAIVQREAELAQQRSDVMMSQIRPHFLYNSLTAIADLCDEDPSLAQRMTLDFATYLRGSMDSINEREPIPFARELAHTRSYLAIEQARFGDKLSVVYDVQVTNFDIPALTLQPVVENAVKHGVSAKRGPGTVSISVKDCGDEIQICVKDDGLGFDVKKMQSEGDNRNHVGIANVDSRLKNMVGGSLEMASDGQTGTCATLHVPHREVKR